MASITEIISVFTRPILSDNAPANNRAEVFANAKIDTDNTANANGK